MDLPLWLSILLSVITLFGMCSLLPLFVAVLDWVDNDIWLWIIFPVFICALLGIALLFPLWWNAGYAGVGS